MTSVIPRTICGIPAHAENDSKVAAEFRPRGVRPAGHAREWLGMDISIIIVNWNTRELLRKCLDSVETTVRSLSHEIIVVDNASTDGSAAMLRERFPRVRLIENLENRGFGAANNQALRVMTGRYALLLNSDAVLTENAVSELFACMENHPEAAMACGQLLNADGSRQNSIAAFPSLLTLMTNTPLLEYLFPRRFPSKRYSHSGPVEVDSGIGACLMVRMAAMDAVGLFDERYYFFFEETDWAYQMRRAGWKVLHVPTAFIYHLQGQSIGRNFQLPDRVLPLPLPVLPQMEESSLLYCGLRRDPAAAGSGLVSDLRWRCF